jgi:hypothetical protein
MTHTKRYRKSFWRRNQFPIIAALSSSLVIAWSSAAKAQIWSPLKQSMQCIVNAASAGGGGSSGMLTQLPGLVVAVIGLACFIIAAVLVIRGWSQSSHGEDSTNTIRAAVGGILGGVVILLFQNFFLAGNSCA